MIGPRNNGPLQCPNCRSVIDERDPLIGWWLCDECGLALEADGKRITYSAGTGSYT
ncbi:hypothetical protein [Natrinema caseinilyticum]|uniref:hypothetical protein n=1 Tax=Natrinema caseinilyticum TaxID=2961570 RepID=UPI0020C3E68E|nr:hypothetical protein [Natrinema caseinilyticum]